MTEVVQLPFNGAVRSPIDDAIRTGEFSCRRLGDIHVVGRLPARAVIVNETGARFQKELTRSLRASGADVTLDRRVAELGDVGRFSGPTA